MCKRWLRHAGIKSIHSLDGVYVRHQRNFGLLKGTDWEVKKIPMSDLMHPRMRAEGLFTFAFALICYGESCSEGLDPRVSSGGACSVPFRNASGDPGAYEAGAKASLPFHGALL